MATPPADSITVNLSLTSSPSSPRITISLPVSSTTSQLRQIASDSTKIPLPSLKLIFRGRLIPGDDKIAKDEFKLDDGCVVHCMGKPVASATPTSAANPTPSPSVATAAGPSLATPTPAATATTTTTSPTSLSAALTLLQSRNTPTDYTTALTTLSKILTNITSHPMEEKYRRMKKGNAAFQKRLGGKVGGDDCLKAVGFELISENGEEVYNLAPSPEKWTKLLECQKDVSARVTAHRTAGATTANTWGIPGATPSVPPVGMGGIPPMMPGMESAVQNMMSNPEMLNQMLQNPMVQDAMSRDPRMANNPMLRQSLEALRSNPEMVNQVSRMMSDPMFRQQMETMMNDPNMRRRMEQMGNFGGAGAGGMGNMGNMMQAWQQQMQGGATPSTTGVTPTGGAPPTQQQQQSGGGEDGEREMTEEEMIAEAIARSLRET